MPFSLCYVTLYLIPSYLLLETGDPMELSQALSLVVVLLLSLGLVRLIAIQQTPQVPIEAE